MQTSMTYPAPTAASVTDDRCPPHAWITLRTTTSCSRCGQIRWEGLHAGLPTSLDNSATRTRSAAHSADVLRSETERTPVTYPSIAEEGAE